MRWLLAINLFGCSSSHSVCMPSIPHITSYIMDEMKIRYGYFFVVVVVWWSPMILWMATLCTNNRKKVFCELERIFKCKSCVKVMKFLLMHKWSVFVRIMLTNAWNFTCINIRITIIIISLSRPTKKNRSLREKWKELKGVKEKFLALAIFGSMIIDARALLHERNKNDADASRWIHYLRLDGFWCG